MTEELHRKYRPKVLKALKGQSRAVSILSAMLRQKKLPHQLLFTGPSGCGKTTSARIIARKLDCSERDLREVNAADFRGIDTIREIREKMSLSPLEGTTKVYLIDEAHKLSNDAQNAILKMLEQPPQHVYFMLATTEPQKLIKTIRTRCTEVKLGLLGDVALRELVIEVTKAEGGHLTQEVIDKLTLSSEGSARKALVILQTVLGQDGEEEQLRAIDAADSQNEAINICRALLAKGTNWPTMQKLLKTVEDEAESLRRAILNYTMGCLLGNSPAIHAKAYMILVAFSEPYYDTGKAGLVASCYEVVTRKGH